MNPRYYAHINAFNARQPHHSPAVQGQSNFRHLGNADGQLHSNFALDQLTELAKRNSQKDFLLLMAPTFGFDIPAHTYLKLYEALLDGNVKNPEYRVESTGVFPADYNNQTRTLRIFPIALECIIESPETTWELMAILLHEFGHHLDNVLRQDLADKNPDGTSSLASDAHLEEGSRHAYRMALFDSLDVREVEIARYTPSGTPTIVIRTDYAKAMHLIRQTQAGGTLHQHAADDFVEAFEAGSGGPGKFTHESIEAILRSMGFHQAEVNGIYFGNWLRDYSQLLDPKIVRATTMPKNFPDVFSREALTKIVDVLAVKKFWNQNQVRPDYFKVTQDKLGVYRPSQHIDNPKVVDPQPADPTSRDPDFEPWVMPGDPVLEVDPATSMKRHIQRSVAVMQDELRAVMRDRRTPAGLRMFGAALHILEDFFAHSNFVELSLIKEGHLDVLPWTSIAPCKHHLPLVTGMFGATDVFASLADPIGKILFSTEPADFQPTQAGHRSERDQLMLILLAEHQDQHLLTGFEAYLLARDTWAKLPIAEQVEKLFWTASAPTVVVRNAYNTMMQGVLRLIGNSIDDVQTSIGEDPNTSGSTDPSHSQLAKDHAEHPLHALAGVLATEAVKNVTQTMLDYWDGKPGADPIAVATSYFVHPMDSSWQDSTVRHWAITHSDQVRRSTIKSELDQIRAHLHDEAKTSVQRLEKEGRDYLNFITSDSFLGVLIDKVPKKWIDFAKGPFKIKPWA
ncbi:HET-C-related protein [Pseudomonas sp. NA-150]|uniref:HET-C-related protein n=1 Tax=Pseudomonas sp. NA-150 TaxID=3367525 RepID=UPI0037CC4FF5